MNRLLLWGAGGHALSLREALHRSGRPINAFVVDEGHSAHPDLAPLLRGEAELLPWLASTPAEFLIAIGLHGAVRERIAGMAQRIGLSPIAFHDSTAIISGNSHRAPGSQVLALAYLGPRVILGAHSIVNVGAIVEHEARIGAFSDIAPRATILGQAKIGARVLVGASATVLPGIGVCDDVVIGAGAVVTRDIDTSGIYVGVPARPIAKA